MMSQVLQIHKTCTISSLTINQATVQNMGKSRTFVRLHLHLVPTCNLRWDWVYLFPQNIDSAHVIP